MHQCSRHKPRYTTCRALPLLCAKVSQEIIDYSETSAAWSDDTNSICLYDVHISHVSASTVPSLPPFYPKLANLSFPQDARLDCGQTAPFSSQAGPNPQLTCLGQVAQVLAWKYNLQPAVSRSEQATIWPSGRASCSNSCVPQY